MRIEKSIVWPKGGGWHFDSPKTRKSGRTISLPVELLDELREHRIRQLEHKQFLGKDWKSEHDLVFTDTTGNAVYERHLTTRTFKVVLKEAGLPTNFRLYDLRHTCATLLLIAGVPAKVVAERLGHYVASRLWERVVYGRPPHQTGVCAGRISSYKRVRAGLWPIRPNLRQLSTSISYPSECSSPLAVPARAI